MIDNELEHFIKEHSYLFYTFLNEMVVPEFSDEIDTACVIFDSNDKNFSFLINPSFWEQLNFFSKAFLISHEIMHVLLKHGKRGKQFLKNLPDENRSSTLLNATMDISINEMLLRELDFTMGLLNFPQGGCFVETVFKDEDVIEHNISKDETFDYYYHFYIKLYGLAEPPPETFDDHNTMHSDAQSDSSSDCDGNGDGDSDYSDGEGGSSSESEEDILDELIDNLLDGEKGFFHSEGNSDLENNQDFVIKKSKSLEDYFKISIKTSSKMKEIEKNKHIWHGYNRRLSPIMSSIDPKMSIPSTQKQHDFRKEKHKILIYLDSSYSCLEQSEKLLTLAANLPHRKFETHLYSFSNNVKEIIKNKKNEYKITNTGGTSIHAVCDHSKSLFLTDNFDAVFVLTDAEFSPITMSDLSFPKKWFFFIIPFPNKAHITTTIPDKVKRFLIPHNQE